MKFYQIKQRACEFLVSVGSFVLLMLICAAVQGTLFLPLALALGLGDLMAMNVLCGLCAPAQTKAAPKPVKLRVVQGGRAA